MVVEPSVRPLTSPFSFTEAMASLEEVKTRAVPEGVTFALMFPTSPTLILSSVGETLNLI